MVKHAVHSKWLKQYVKKLRSGKGKRMCKHYQRLGRRGKGIFKRSSRRTRKSKHGRGFLDWVKGLFGKKGEVPPQTGQQPEAPPPKPIPEMVKPPSAPSVPPPPIPQPVAAPTVTHSYDDSQKKRIKMFLGQLEFLVNQRVKKLQEIYDNPNRSDLEKKQYQLTQPILNTLNNIVQSLKLSIGDNNAAEMAVVAKKLQAYASGVKDMIKRAPANNILLTEVFFETIDKLVSSILI